MMRLVWSRYATTGKSRSFVARKQGVLRQLRDMKMAHSPCSIVTSWGDERKGSTMAKTQQKKKDSSWNSPIMGFLATLHEALIVLFAVQTWFFVNWLFPGDMLF